MTMCQGIVTTNKIYDHSILNKLGSYEESIFPQRWHTTKMFHELLRGWTHRETMDIDMMPHSAHIVIGQLRVPLTKLDI